MFIPTIKTHLATRPAEPETTIIEAIHGGIMHPNTLRAQFDKAKIEAGRPDLHFHTLRAPFVTGVIHQDDATLKETMELTGHTGATVNALYQRADSQRKRETVERFGNYLANSRTREQLEREIAETEEKLMVLKRKSIEFISLEDQAKD